MASLGRFEDLKVVELKTELRDRGLMVSGVKAVLIQRLQEYEEALTAFDKPQPTPTGGSSYAQAGNDMPAGAKRAAETPAKKAKTSKPASPPAMTTPPTVKKPTTTEYTGSDCDDNYANEMGSHSEAGAVAVALEREPVSTAGRDSSTGKGKEVSLRRSSRATYSTYGSSLRNASQTFSDPTNTRGHSVESTPSTSTLCANTTVIGSVAAGFQKQREVGGNRYSYAVGMGAVGVGAENKVAIFLAVSGVLLCAACIGLGDGLTGANLLSLHVSMAGLGVVARSTNSRSTGLRALLAKAIATTALAYVMSVALRQAAITEKLAVAAGRVEDNDTGSCDGADDGEIGLRQCVTAAEEASETAVSAVLGKVSRWLGRHKDHEESWRSARFGVVEFWGWASVAMFLTFYETLPVLLSPLHGVIRALNRTHNYLIALTSFGMLVGITHSTLKSGKAGGIHDLLCKPMDESDLVFTVTSQVFFWSKAWEWFDTALLVAKGKPVSWLHYTHHASTAVLTMLNMVPIMNAMWPVACATNSFVHTWMYGYYAFPGSQLLRSARKLLTRAQMVQHVAVLASAIYVVVQLKSGNECYNSPRSMYTGLGLYLMYLVFFALFYVKSYGDRREFRPRCTE